MKTRVTDTAEPAQSIIASFVENIARAAGANLMSHFKNLTEIAYKSDSSVVTVADLSTEKLIIDAIKKEFPNDLILAEESHQKLTAGKHSGSVWIIDPLDGTSNFANGYGFFCTSIARYSFNSKQVLVPQVGVIFDPIRDGMYVAELGQGARKNGQILRVRKPSELAKAFLVTGFSYVNGDALDFEINRFKRIAQSCQTIRRDGAAALDLAMVAEGTFHAFWENNLSPWDVAAGALIVAEAGGVVRNYDPELSFYNVLDGSIIAGFPETVEQLAGLLV